MNSKRARLEIRAIVVSWRDIVADVRAGWIPESRESMQRVTAWALGQLDRVERSLDGDPADKADIHQRLLEARSEVHGAAFHDLSDSGEQAG
jgi:hypothetical protein